MFKIPEEILFFFLALSMTKLMQEMPNVSSVRFFINFVCLQKMNKMKTERKNECEK